jgi:UDP-N-acetyl-D-mannosaminouronate:lipid I N-acetyl-D-mannosaminouronosyltransferase
VDYARWCGVRASAGAYSRLKPAPGAAILGDFGERVPSAYLRGFRTYAFASESALITAVNGPALLVAINGEKLANADATLRRIANAHIGYPDGIGAVLALRRRGLRSARIAGSDLWLTVIRRYAGERRFYLVGSTAPVAQEAATRLQRNFPGLEIVGARDGFLDADDESRLVDHLHETKPDVVLVAMGSPRQEILMERLLAAWPALYMGLGGSLDIYVGQRRRAPRWMQRIGLEWLYRFVENPRRLRRLPAYGRFAWLLARGRV